MIDFAHYYTLFLVLFGVVILGITAGVVGVFAFLSEQSLLGDAISHAALPGIVLMFLLTHSQSPVLLLFGGAIAGAIGTLFIMLIHHKTSLKKDAALGIVLSVFFGFGLVLLTYVQKKGIAQQGILNKFLFGSAATLLPEDIIMMGTVSFCILFIIRACWKELKIVSFDPLYATSLGYHVAIVHRILMFLLVSAIVIGLQTVGTILMSTLFIAPAVAARQWTNRIESMALLSGLIGAIACVIGVLISHQWAHTPTGPVIVVVLSIVVCISLICAQLTKFLNKYE
jgi:manganese/zinc/iron transport system permease protein